MNPPPAVVSVSSTPRIARTSSSSRRITCSIAATLVPSGAVTRTENSASSTSLGVNSRFTRWYSGTELRITNTATALTTRRWRTDHASSVA
jgi:hypothetical protein